MRRLIVCLAAIAFAGPVHAAPVHAAEGAPGTGVEMPYLIAPMNVDGKLVSYAYISTRLTTRSDIDAIAVRDRIAFVQDAFVRDVNGAPVTGDGDSRSVDIPALEARLLADARRIVGKARVTAIHVTRIQVAPLHPTETPELSGAAAPPASAPPAGE